MACLPLRPMHDFVTFCNGQLEDGSMRYVDIPLSTLKNICIMINKSRLLIPPLFKIWEAEEITA